MTPRTKTGRKLVAALRAGGVLPPSLEEMICLVEDEAAAAPTPPDAPDVRGARTRFQRAFPAGIAVGDQLDMTTQRIRSLNEIEELLSTPPDALCQHNFAVGSYCNHCPGYVARIAPQPADALREAARDLLSAQDADDDYCFGCHGPRPCEHDALRAALREGE